MSDSLLCFCVSILALLHPLAILIREGEDMDFLLGDTFAVCTGAKGGFYTAVDIYFYPQKIDYN